MQLACAWNLAHPAVACVVPTLIQEAGTDARPIEDKRSELAALPRTELDPEDVAAIREIGDNTGSMKLKGASAEHEGEDAPDRWSLSARARRGRRAAPGSRRERDLAYAGAANASLAGQAGFFAERVEARVARLVGDGLGHQGRR